MKYRIAKVVDDSDYEEYPYLVAIDPIGAIKTKLWKIRGMIFNQVDRINHPCICSLISRHKMPESTDEPYHLDVFGPQKCLRCGEVRSVGLSLSSALWAALNAEADVYSKWAEFSKVVFLPPGVKPANIN